jgi:histidinol-phosphatase (PHP family)
MYTNIFDSHCHSTNSHDGKSTVDELCKMAIEKGLMGFSLTDHCEVDLYKGDYIKNIDKSFFDIELAKEKYKEKLILSSGIEIGQGNYDLELTSEIINKSSYDFIIASTHGIGDTGDLCKLNYNEMSLNEIYTLLNNYFEYYFEMVKVCDFDTAAHITYPLRYIEGIYKKDINLSGFYDIIDEIFKVLISRNKSLEINTSGLRQKIKKPFPTKELIIRYKELGGELITLGSDSHKAIDLAANFDEIIEFLKVVGFKDYFYYKNREPIGIKLK